MENASHDSTKRKFQQAFNDDKLHMITSARLQGDSDDQYKVGLDVHDSLIKCYNKQLKEDLKSKLESFFVGIFRISLDVNTYDIFREHFNEEVWDQL